MIDIRTETILTLSQAAAMLPGRPSIASMWRWRTKGVRGRKLESIAVGGKVYTSAEALQRFAAQSGGETMRANMPRQRQRSIERAERELRDAGI